MLDYFLRLSQSETVADSILNSGFRARQGVPSGNGYVIAYMMFLRMRLIVA